MNSKESIAQLNKLEEDIKRRNFESSHLVAEKIIQYFNYIVMQGKYESPNDLLTYVQETGQKLQKADTLNFVVPNTIKRILHIIREAQNECKFIKNEQNNDLKGLIDFGKITLVKERVSYDDSMMFEKRQNQFDTDSKKTSQRKTTVGNGSQTFSSGSKTMMKSFTEGAKDEV